ncbi:hypothetical protein [Paenibacillus sp. GXUN7292]|uniref:hypothetical protein n=1 Tax=Paenibacillus sp. GXUN7292 TaxID=3422499 RepID=UPI003D7DBC58
MIQDKDRHYNTLICGATFSGVGALLASPDNALIVERTAMVGGEYIEAINPGQPGSLSLSTHFGRNINEELVARNLIEPAGGPLHLPALHPVLCRKLLDAQASILLLTEIVAVKPHERGYEVTICNAAGWQVFTVSNILDTTSRRATCPGERLESVARSLNAYILANDPELALPSLEHPSVELVQGRFASEHILKWRIAPEEDWLAARDALVRFWASRPASLQPWTIAATATELEYRVPVGARQLGECWHWLPSAGYDHPLLAMEHGFVYRSLGVDNENGNL